MMIRSRVLVLSGLLLAGCFGGASDTPDLGSVQGKVTLDKQPLANARVLFSPIEGGRPAIATTESNGSYELMYSPGNPGATPGKYSISISTALTVTDEQTGEDVQVPEKVPAKYNAHTTLEREVVAGSNTFDFDLDSQGEIYSEENDKNSGSASCCN